MSGSGGGNGGNGGNGAVDCLTLSFRTTLASPDREVISELNVGDVLVVGPSADGRSVIASSGDRVAGAITSGRLADLLKCLEENFEYIARVVGIEGGACTIELRPKPEA